MAWVVLRQRRTLMFVVYGKLDMAALCDCRKEREGTTISRGDLPRISPLFFLFLSWHIECSCWNLWENDSEWTLTIMVSSSALMWRLANCANALSLSLSLPLALSLFFFCSRYTYTHAYTHAHTKAPCVCRSTERSHISLYHRRG